jgi:Putative amidase domain
LGGCRKFPPFLEGQGRGTLSKNVYDLELGDVLQRDHGDDIIHHTMIVTEKGNDVINGKPISQIWLSYHTKDTLNRKFWGQGKSIKKLLTARGSDDQVCV